MEENNEEFNDQIGEQRFDKAFNEKTKQIEKLVIEQEIKYQSIPVDTDHYKYVCCLTYIGKPTLLKKSIEYLDKNFPYLDSYRLFIGVEDNEDFEFATLENAYVYTNKRKAKEESELSFQLDQLNNWFNDVYDIYPVWKFRVISLFEAKSFNKKYFHKK